MQTVWVRVTVPLSLIITLNISTLDPLLSHVIAHTSQASETHYYPISSPDHRILLHTHNSAPYVPRISASEDKTLVFTIYFSGSTGCSADLAGFTIEVDWSATLGRWASRYPTTLVSWAVGVVAFVMFSAWGSSDNGHSKYLVFFFIIDLLIHFTSACRTSIVIHIQPQDPKATNGGFFSRILSSAPGRLLPWK